MRRNNHKRKIAVIIFLLILLIFFSIYIYFYYKNVDLYSNYETSKLQSTKIVQTVDEVIEESTSIADMIEIVSSSVVGISKLNNTGNSIFSSSDDLELGLGTGVIVSNNGYILSNSHVTGEKYSTCYVTLENGETYTGLVVWSDTSLDLSITKINASDLPYVTLGDSSALRAGETVFAIGDPIGYEFRRTVTSGIISAVNRTILIEDTNNVSYMTDLIQTDATINPGNSGGPLLLSNGEVIGINTVKITSAEGMGFATPINVVKPVIDKFASTGSFDEATIGILAYDKAATNYLSSSADFESGIYVVDITGNSPAANSSLQVGDVITSIDDTVLNTMNDLKQYVFSKSPGDEVVLRVSRNFGTANIKIVLGKK